MDTRFGKYSLYVDNRPMIYGWEPWEGEKKPDKKTC